MIFSKPVFQLWPEVPDKTLDWPSSAVSQSADGVASICLLSSQIISISSGCALPSVNLHIIVFIQSIPSLRGCTDHMTRACRTLQALQLP